MAQANAFTRSLTAEQIVTLAERKAGGPGFHLKADGTAETTAPFTSPAYVQLQVILDHLALNGDWPWRHDALTLTVNTQVTALPLDYWHSNFSHAYLLDSSYKRLGQIPIFGHQDFHDILPNALSDASGTGMPTRMSIQKNRGTANGGTGAPQIVVDVAPNGTYYIELHYDPLPPALTGVTDKPWFPWSAYLIDKLLADLYLAQDDTRATLAAASAEKMLTEIKRGQSDAGQRSLQVGYHAAVYRAPIRMN